jgi:hypothetical protein
MTTMRQRDRGSDRDAWRADVSEAPQVPMELGPHPREWQRAPPLGQSLSHPNEVCRHRLGVAPFTLAIAIGEIEAQRRRVGIDDDLGPAEAARGLFREPEQNAAVALPLQIAADGDEAKACLGLADEVDAHRAYDLAVADEHVRKVAMLEFVRVVLLIGLARQQSAEDRVPANGMIGAPLLRQSRRPQRVTLERMIHRCPCQIPLRLSV